MVWRDTPAGYGVVSIALHWLAAIAIIGLLVTGNALSGSAAEDHETYRQVHTGIALSGYVLLVFRVVWRFRQGHPGALQEQNSRLVALAKVAHYALLLIILVMLLSGPGLAITGAIPISWFGMAEWVPPGGGRADAFYLLHQIHRTGAIAVFFLLLAHVGGALWHMIVLRDRTMDKILLPAVDQKPTKAAGTTNPIAPK